MTISTKCKCGKPRKAGGRYCLECHAAYMRAHRPIHSALPDDQRKKANTRAYANACLRRGKIKREGCKVCGNPAQMHHEDYDKPLEVMWLCRDHHLQHHNCHVEQSTGGKIK